MSTTIKSKKKPQPVSPVAKYKVGQKVFVIGYHKGKPEDLLEGEVIGRRTFEEEEFDSLGKKVGNHTTFTYSVRVASSLPMSVRHLCEAEIIATFPEAAKAFVLPYLALIK